jgi:rhodanese-related sulfurtransferase
MRALPSPSRLSLCLCLCLAPLASACSSSSDAVTAPDAAADSAPDSAPDSAADSAPAPDTAIDAGPCNGAPTFTALDRLSPTALDALIKAQSPIIIDVHTPYAGALPGTAAHIVYTDVDALETFVGHDHCANVVLTCLGGPMSQSAGNALIARGYLRVHDLLGGMNAWEAAGYTLVK